MDQSRQLTSMSKVRSCGPWPRPLPCPHLGTKERCCIILYGHRVVFEWSKKACRAMPCNSLWSPCHGLTRYEIPASADLFPWAQCAYRWSTEELALGPHKKDPQHVQATEELLCFASGHFKWMLILSGHGPYVMAHGPHPPQPFGPSLFPRYTMPQGRNGSPFRQCFSKGSWPSML